jgi:cytochrome c-type biogenesis protein CcmF
MISLLGHVVVSLGLVAAVIGAAASFAAGYLEREDLAGWGERATFGVLACVAAAVVLMEIALIGHDFSVKYVADVGSRETPLYYTIISLWGALEGSILLWALLLSAYTVAFVLLSRGRFAAIRPYAIGIMLTVSTFFLLVIGFPGDPFVALSPVPADGAGPNPLLQNHPMMGIHPPLLYLGFTGTTVPFAVAMAALLKGRTGPDVMRLIRRWSLIPWSFLTFGIIAGMWWSYAVLGWGGYWEWDPVENASLMPWLVTTAFLHSLQVQERRRMLKTWTMTLITSAFVLSILGTFLTRSGVLKSVHSFTQSPIGPFFLGFLAVILAFSTAVLVARSADLRATGTLDAVICRETAFMLNNLLLVAITFTVLLGTLFPILVNAVQGSQVSVGGPYFDRVAVPMGIALVFLMGVGPLLPWGRTRLDDLQYRLLPGVAVGIGTVLLALMLGARGVGTLATFGLACFVAAVTIERAIQDARCRGSSTGEGLGIALPRLFGLNPRRYGGYLAHLGLMLVLIGIAASQSYGLRQQATLRPGQSIRLDGYVVTYRSFSVRPESQRMAFEARVTAARPGEDLGTMSPALNVYPPQQPVVTPAIREEPLDMLTGLLSGRNPLPQLGEILHGRNPFEDVYVVLQGFDSANANRHNPNRTIDLQVIVNPLVGLIWLGGLLTGLGGLAALLPAQRRRRVESPASESLRLQPEEARL